MEEEYTKKQIKNYKEFRKIQKSLREYDISSTEFDVLVELYLNDGWISFEESRKRSGIKHKCSFSERGIGILKLQGYAEIRKNPDNTKDARITFEGKNLVEKIFGN